MCFRVINYGACNAGIDVKIEGFNDKLPLLTKLVFQTLATLDFQDEDYVRIHEELVRSYRNALMKPGKHAAYSRLLVLKLHLWGMDPLLHELEGMTATEIRDFVNRDSESYILKDAHVRCLFMGNLSSGEALDLGKTVSELLDASGLPGVGDRTLRIPDNWSLLLTEKAINIEEENSAVEIYIQCGLATDPRTRALVDMVDQLMYEPCYDTLRTKEQLGYTVSSGSRLTHGVMGFGIFVQSGTHGPLYLDERVESFLVGFEQRLMEMPAEEFEQNRQSLLKAKKMKDKSMIEEVERAWDGLVNRGSDFMARKDEVAALEEVTQNEVIQFYSKFFTPAASGSIRKRLAVYVAGKEHREDGSISAEAAPTWVTRVIGDVEMFKRDCSKNLESSFYPAVTIPSL